MQEVNTITYPAVKYMIEWQHVKTPDCQYFFNF